MKDFVDRFIKNPKTTLEGFVWGAVVVGVISYAFDSFHCTVPKDMNWTAWALGIIPVVRGIMAKDPQPKLEEVKPA